MAPGQQMIALWTGPQYCGGGWWLFFDGTNVGLNDRARGQTKWRAKRGQLVFAFRMNFNTYIDTTAADELSIFAGGYSGHHSTRLGSRNWHNQSCRRSPGGKNGSGEPINNQWQQRYQQKVVLGCRNHWQHRRLQSPLTTTPGYLNLNQMVATSVLIHCSSSSFGCWLECHRISGLTASLPVKTNTVKILTGAINLASSE